MGENEQRNEKSSKEQHGHETSARDPSFSCGEDRSQDGGESSPPTAHVVLYQPEIPQNTGNIGRSCVAAGAKLWLVHPMGFQIDEKRVRRAGLDYWQHLNWTDVPNWESITEALPTSRMFFLSRFARRRIWEAEFKPGDVFVFGRETAGLPDTILDPRSENALRLPTSPHVRSLNLATTVGIVLYEHMRQTGIEPG